MTRRLLLAATMLLVAGAAPRPPEATPVRGASWLQRLGTSLDETHLGRMGGEGPPGAAAEPMPRPDDEANPPFALAGADLYRLSCRACHGPDGRGAPPEINSLLDPIRATSPALLEARQREQGRRLPPGMARRLAAEAEAALRDRIAHGGKRMPALPQLAREDVDALLAYLGALAGVPGAKPASPAVTASAVRAGELLVKGTCHVCHPATGPTPSHMAMYMQGIIPPLASFPERLAPAEVVAKVREGRMAGMGGMGGMGGGMGGGGMMGGRMMMGHMGRMPVFGYLTDEEVAAAYLYLSRYPPRP